MIRDVPFWRVQAFSPEFKVQSKIPTNKKKQIERGNNKI
jgi:hypothetical protein